MKSSEIRSRFFEFFIKNNHKKVASSSLIPAQDPTLLFTNAGMNQFKDLFLGLEKRSYSRAVSIQKCVRAGGKHNDLDNVGFTQRHCTFFEMMGNFSFGDYFKKEAIQYAWDFLTKELNLSTTNLHVSVFETDDESYDLWHTLIGVPKDKIHRLGEKENFWSMGDVGLCGPCTELHVDRGPTFGCADDIGCGPACDCDRFLEIWNLVFMQFDRQADGTLKELKHKGVDTGAGLERISVIMQNKASVFQTDLFTPIITRTEEITGKKYAEQTDALKAAFHVLADHARSTTLLISDGCAPSNDGRGYVLRKIIRRAALFAQKLSDDQLLFPELSRTVIENLSIYYPELTANASLIYEILSSEIQKFSQNLIRGKNILNEYFKESIDTKLITGQQTFKMYDTYGFPLELIILIAHEHGYRVDEKGFEVMMHMQQTQSGKKTVDPFDNFDLDASIQTTFTGYNELSTTSTINGLIYNDSLVTTVPSDQVCWLFAEKSPYFIVGGGQVPDTGSITIGTHTLPLIKVRFINGKIAAQVKTVTPITVGDTITSHVDPVWRTNAMNNHTGTHLLQAALIEILGKTVKQAGSLVHPDYLRFDFTYHEHISAENIKKIEDMVNAKIRENIPVSIEYTTMRNAVKQGALAFFGDKYNPENVRMVAVNNFSVELCGGTHVPATGAIGCFKITESTALSAGHRRIVAVTGAGAIDLFQETCTIVKHLTQEFKVKRENVINATLKLKIENKDLSHEVRQLKKQLWHMQLQTDKTRIASINGIPYLYSTFKNVTNEDLREIATELSHEKPGFYFLQSSLEDRCIFLGNLSAEFADTFDLKKFALWLKEKHSLYSGVTKNSVRGGGEKFEANLGDRIKGWIEKHVNI